MKDGPELSPAPPCPSAPTVDPALGDAGVKEDVEGAAVVVGTQEEAGQALVPALSSPPPAVVSAVGQVTEALPWVLLIAEHKPTPPSGLEIFTPSVLVTPAGLKLTPRVGMGRPLPPHLTGGTVTMILAENSSVRAWTRWDRKNQQSWAKACPRRPE